MRTLPGCILDNHCSGDRDAIITCIVNTLTCLIAGVLVFSILGYMAHIQETTIDEVVNSGPGLVFLTYPDLVSAADIYLCNRVAGSR